MYDISIIGSGASGIAIANKLSKSKNKILLISESDLGRSGYEYKEKQKYKNEISRYRGYFGSLNIWGNVCRPLDKIDFSDPSYIPDKKYFVEASKLLNCSYGIKYWFSSNLHHNLFDRKLCKILSNNKFKQNTYTMNLPPRPINDSLVKKAYTFYNSAEQKISGTKVVCSNVSVECISKVGSIYSIQGFCKKTKKTINIHSKKIVLATGSISNFEIITRSILFKKLEEKNSILSKIGKNISDHFQGNFGALILDKKINVPGKKICNSQKLRASFTPNSNNIKGRHGIYLLPAFGKLSSQSNEEIKTELLSFLKDKSFFRLVKSIIKNPFGFYEVLSYVLFDNKKINKFYVWGVFEQISSRHELIYDVDNDKTVLNWKISDRDYQEVNNVMSVVQEAFRPIIKKSFKFSRHKLSKNLIPSQHLVGSLIQGSGKHSVVDSKYNIVGYDNIFCADASILPARGFSNITLTVVANSLKLGDLLLRCK